MNRRNVARILPDPLGGLTIHPGVNHFSPYLLWLTIGAGALLLVALLIMIWRRGRSDRGRMRRVLKQLSGVYLQEVLIPDGLGGEIQIDYLVRLPDRFLVIDLKEMSGVLFGSEQIDEWTQIVNRRSYRFRNPLHDNRARCQAVAELVKPNEVLGRVVFTDTGEFPRGRPQGVSTMATLIGDLAHPQMAAPRPDLDKVWQKLTHLATPAPPIKI